MIEVAVTVEASPRRVAKRLLEKAGRRVLADHGREGTLSIAVVDDATIHRLNREHLDHDYPTDCLSFDLEPTLGEVVVSSETALREAEARGIPFAEELLRYVVHATLHLCGYDDRTPAKRKTMHARQEEYVAELLPRGRRQRTSNVGRRKDEHAAYKRFIDELVDLSRSPVSSTRIRRHGHAERTNDADAPLARDEQARKEFLLRCTPAQREMVARMLENVAWGQVHDVACWLEWQLSCGGMTIAWNGEPVPASPYESMHFDLVSRRAGEAWPDER